MQRGSQIKAGAMRSAVRIELFIAKVLSRVSYRVFEYLANTGSINKL